MSYALKESPGRVEAEVAAESGEALLREAFRATLHAVYGSEEPAQIVAPRVVPIQGGGDDDAGVLSDLLPELLAFTGSTGGRLCSPRWMAFDDRRVTATFPVAEIAVTPRSLHLVRSVGKSGKVRLVFGDGPATT